MDVSRGHDGEDEPSEAELDAWRVRMQAPDNEVPHPVPVALLLGRTDDVAVALLGVSAYTTGVAFDLVVRLRVRPPGLRRHELHDLLGGFPGDEVDAARRLLLGVEFADGRRASNITGRGWEPRQLGEREPVLHQGGGRGGELTHDQTWWLSPVPPEGPVTVVCAWPALGLPETSHVVDGDALVQASQRAVVLWPRQQEREPEPPPPPVLPTSGWFAGEAGS